MLSPTASAPGGVAAESQPLLRETALNCIKHGLFSCAHHSLLTESKPYTSLAILGEVLPSIRSFNTSSLLLFLGSP